jgi:predicted lactoylglutathione lyase
MKKQIFVNLVVFDLLKSAEFYTQLGFSPNPKFSDESAKCMVWSEEIFLMIMSAERFKTFATKPLADTKNNLAGLFALSVENFEQVNKIVDAGLKAGGKEPKPMIDNGFMKLRTIEDYDGHTWEIFYMDESKFPP